MSYFYKLSQNYLSVLENGEYSDVIVRVGKENNMEEFAVHSFVLRTQSPYFRNVLSNYEITRNKIILEEKNINPNEFKIILKYFYGGIFNLESIEFETLIGILIAVNEFNIDELIYNLQDYLIKNEKQLIFQNFVKIYKISSKYESCKKLNRFCSNIIISQPEIIFKCEDFDEIDEDTLILIFQNELQMEEIEIWNYIIKWGIKRTSSITTSDTTLWTKENFRDLSNTLKQIIPLIIFIKITPNDFYTKIKKYKKVLGKNLYDEILQYHLTQNITIDSILIQQKRINSVIINLKHLSLISSWIDKKLKIPSEYLKYPPYKFKLLLRGSRDGLKPEVFHRLCDNKGATVTIVKEPYTNNILGGYNPLSWKSCKDVWNPDYTSKTYDAFIFSISDINIQNSIISRPKNEECILNYSESGPNFQIAFSFINSTQYKCMCLKNNEYDKPIRQSEEGFLVEEYEVFQVLKL